MSNLQITRRHIENLILSCFINQKRTLPLDEIEFKDLIVPYELFKASRTHKLIAKAIFNLQEKKSLIDEVLLLDYISEKTKINTDEWFEITCTNWCTFDTCVAYIEKLKEIDTAENKKALLRGI